MLDIIPLGDTYSFRDGSRELLSLPRNTSQEIVERIGRAIQDTYDLGYADGHEIGYNEGCDDGRPDV